MSIDLDDVAGVLNFSGLDTAIDAAVEGGSAPEWVPENAVIYIDLIAPGRAWTEDDGEVAIDTLLGTDANTVNGWAETSYDPENLTVDGYGGPELSPTIAFIGAARTKILDTFTCVFKIKLIEGNADGGNSLALLAADGNDALEADVNVGSRQFRLVSWGGSLNEISNNVTNSGVGAVNVAAITIDGTRFEGAVNGVTSLLTATIGNDDRPAGNPLVAALIGCSQGTAIQSITIYDALPSTAGLSALSETGVTNTAPTAITWQWQVPTVDGAITADWMDDATRQIVLIQGVTDAEGNPVSWSISDDVAGRFAIADSFVTMLMSQDSIGPYNFTLRATDPGGLYVEQEFTITVIA